jgi:hypothetical protein
MIILMLCSGKCEVALFGDYVDIMQKLAGKSVDGFSVVVAQFVNVKIFRGNCCLG